ncbi:hypothetical protein PSPO01_08262 [Paraphaeosphaeria sporulosa]
MSLAGQSHPPSSLSRASWLCALPHWAAAPNPSRRCGARASAEHHWQPSYALAFSTMTAGVDGAVVRAKRAWRSAFSTSPYHILLFHLVVNPHSVPGHAEWCSCPAGSSAQDQNVDLSASSSSGSSLRPCDYTEPPLSFHAFLSI